MGARTLLPARDVLPMSIGDHQNYERLWTQAEPQIVPPHIQLALAGDKDTFSFILHNIYFPSYDTISFN